MYKLFVLHDFVFCQSMSPAQCSETTWLSTADHFRYGCSLTSCCTDRLSSTASLAPQISCCPGICQFATCQVVFMQCGSSTSEMRNQCSSWAEFCHVFIIFMCPYCSKHSSIQPHVCNFQVNSLYPLLTALWWGWLLYEFSSLVRGVFSPLLEVYSTFVRGVFNPCYRCILTLVKGVFLPLLKVYSPIFRGVFSPLLEEYSAFVRGVFCLC